MRLIWKNNQETVKEGQNKNDLVVVKWDGNNIELRDDQSGRSWKFKVPPQNIATLDQFGLAWVENYPKHIVTKVREHLGYDEDDASHDNEIQQMSPQQVLYHVCQYEGLIGYDYWITNRIKDIYGVDLSSL